MAEPDFLTQREYKERHDDLARRIDRLELRVDKVEADQGTRDAEMHRMQADLRRELTENHLKTIEAIHKLSDEVAKGRLATADVETTFKDQMAKNSKEQSDALHDFKQSLTDSKTTEDQLRRNTRIIAFLALAGWIVALTVPVVSWYLMQHH